MRVMWHGLRLFTAVTAMAPPPFFETQYGRYRIDDGRG
jgi:hypothetical protein